MRPISGSRSLCVTAVLALVSCAGGETPATGDAEAACRAQGLEPHTVEFAACLDPAAAATLRRAEQDWRDMTNGVGE